MHITTILSIIKLTVMLAVVDYRMHFY